MCTLHDATPLAIRNGKPITTAIEVRTYERNVALKAAHERAKLRGVRQRVRLCRPDWLVSDVVETSTKKEPWF